MGLFCDIRRTSEWNRRTRTSVFLFTHVYLFCRSLLRHACTSQWSGISSRRACTSLFLFTYVYLYCRSLLWVSFDTCVVPQSGVGSALGAHVRPYSSSYMYISIARLCYGILFMCCTLGRSGSISCHTCTSFFAYLCLFCRSLLRIYFDACVIPWGGVGASPVPHVRLISHMYVSFVGLFYRFLLTHVSNLGAEWARLLAHMNVSCHTCTSLFAHICLYCRSLL